MIIDGTPISDFKMKVLKLEGFHDLPARKNILNEQGNQAKDIMFQSKEATVTLLGKYTDVLAMLDKLNAFETLIKSALKHDVVLIGHGLTFTGVFDKGYEAISYVGGKIVKVIVPVTIL